MNEQADIPVDEKLWTIDDIAEYLGGRSKSAIQNNIITQDDFPKPVRIGHPLWYPSEVKAWVLNHRDE